MKYILPAIAAVAMTAPALAQEPGGISSSAISRCAGKVGMETRLSDPAFGIIMLDGMPWTTIERTDEESNARVIATTVVGTGARRRRDGTLMMFRFVCELDTNGQALMFHARQLLPGRSEALVIAGSAAYIPKMILPHGAELRVQLLDATAQSPDADRSIEPVILTEQVVRSGWKAPILFALHVPERTRLEGRKLLVTALLVVRHRSLFQLTEPHVVTGQDLHKPLVLVLDQVQAPSR